MHKTDFQHLLFLSKSESGRSHLRTLLYHPNLGLWRHTASEKGTGEYDALKESLITHDLLVNFLDLHLLTEALIEGGEAPQDLLSRIHGNIHPERFFPGIPWSSVARGRWCAVPVILVHERSFIRYFILGLLPVSPWDAPLPPWAEGLMDESALKAVTLAEMVARDGHSSREDPGLICFPLTVDNRKIQFTGDSMGLPIALGFMALLKGKPLPGDLAATGSLRENGRVHKVGGISKKVGQAEISGFRVVMLPDENRPAANGRFPELLPVRNFRQAWIFSRLYAPGRVSDLILLERMLDDPGLFVRNCHSVPLEWLSWVKAQGFSRHVETAVAKSRDCFHEFIEAIEACLEKGDPGMAEALAGILEPPYDSDLPQEAPQALFKWYTLNLSMANHHGDTKSSDFWQKKAEKMVENAAVKDVASFAAFCNHTFIGLYHNRYHFAPELPPFLKRIMKSLEGQHYLQCEIMPDAINETLGALYGSIAQNYGFCGPEFLAKTRKYCRLSEKAFGGGVEKRLKAHWLRPFNYLFYAELDAGRRPEAEKALLSYLELKTWGQLIENVPRFSQWQHAALARFFEVAADREQAMGYVEWALKNRNRLVEKRHPWQLWLNNLGRINQKMGREERARTCFSESLALCLSEGTGAAIRVMGLLPLSGLCRLGAKGFQAASVYNQMQSSAAELNKSHFDPILNSEDPVKTLSILWAQPETLFPFTYR